MKLSGYKESREQGREHRTQIRTNNNAVPWWKVKCGWREDYFGLLKSSALHPLTGRRSAWRKLMMRCWDQESCGWNTLMLSSRQKLLLNPAEDFFFCCCGWNPARRCCDLHLYTTCIYTIITVMFLFFYSSLWDMHADVHNWKNTKNKGLISRGAVLGNIHLISVFSIS